MLSPVRLTDGWITLTQLKLGLWNFHHTVAPPSSFCGVSSRNSKWLLPSGGGKQRRGWENKLFYSFKRYIISRKRWEIRRKLLLMTNRKSHMRFRLTLRSMNLDDLDLLQVRILSEFRGILQIWGLTTAKRMKIDQRQNSLLNVFFSGV